MSQQTEGVIGRWYGDYNPLTRSSHDEPKELTIELSALLEREWMSFLADETTGKFRNNDDEYDLSTSPFMSHQPSNPLSKVAKYSVYRRIPPHIISFEDVSLAERNRPQSWIPYQSETSTSNRHCLTPLQLAEDCLKDKVSEWPLVSTTCALLNISHKDHPLDTFQWNNDTSLVRICREEFQLLYGIEACSSYSAQKCQLVGIFQVQNIQQHLRFERARGDGNETQLLYHGTRLSCIRAILNDGLTNAFSGSSSGAKLGAGIYLSADAEIAAKYSVFDGNFLFLLLCEAYHPTLSQRQDDDPGDGICYPSDDQVCILAVMVYRRTPSSLSSSLKRPRNSTDTHQSEMFSLFHRPDTKKKSKMSGVDSHCRVIDCHVGELRKLGYSSLEDWLQANPKHVYIGRDLSDKVRGAVGSKWQNRFNVQRYGTLSLQLFEQNLRQDVKLMSEIQELRHCILGCWCRNSKSPRDKEICHGDVLQRLLANE